jgi:hypothetical protein
MGHETAPGVTPERIVAYLDGELPAGEEAEVARAIAEDPEAARMAAEMSDAARAAAAAFAAVAQAPVPERLERLLAEPKVVPFPTRQQSWRRYLAPAIAASIGVILLAATQLVTTTPRSVLRPASDDAGDTAPDRFAPALYGALDSAKPGETVEYGPPGDASGGRITILGELATASGLTCREFRTAPRGGRAAEDGIACRRPDRGWDVLTEPRP